MRYLSPLAGITALLVVALLPTPAPSHAGGGDVLSLTPVADYPLASIGLRHPSTHRSRTAAAPSASGTACDKDIDVAGSIAGVTFVAAQDNFICTNADIDVYEQDGDMYVVQAGGDDAAFTISRLAADGTPTQIMQTAWLQTNTYTPDVKAFKQGLRRYIALSLERRHLGNAACGVVIVDVTDAPATTIVDQVIGSEWCDVHNSFVENDASGDGRYLYLTADLPNDLRVLDIGDLNNIIEVGRYTHPEASSGNYVHDVTVVDHGGAIGRRVYVSYWDAGLMILDAAHVTPGVVEAGSANQPLNPDHSIDPAGFLMHHAYPSEDGARVFTQDEFLGSAGQEPVQMWDIGLPGQPQYIDGIALGSALMPVVNAAHNLLVDGDRLYVGWYKGGLQAFDFDSGGFLGRPMYHQVQTEADDDAYDGAWGTRLATVGTTTYVLQSDRRFGLIVDVALESLDTDGDSVSDLTDNCPTVPNPDQPDANNNGIGDDCEDADNDGWTDADELFVGTLVDSACAATSAPNDEDPDSLPTDLNDDQRVGLPDIIPYIPVFNTTSPAPPYQARFDTTRDGRIGLPDIILFIPVFNTICTP